MIYIWEKNEKDGKKIEEIKVISPPISITNVPARLLFNVAVFADRCFFIIQEERQIKNKQYKIYPTDQASNNYKKEP